jgi:hypothetical protein
MDLEQLTGRYWRLRRELSTAYEAQPWHSGKIDRLAAQIAETERLIAARSRAGKHVGELSAAFVHQRTGGE